MNGWGFFTERRFARTILNCSVEKGSLARFSIYTFDRPLILYYKITRAGQLSPPRQNHMSEEAARGDGNLKIKEKPQMFSIVREGNFALIFSVS